LTTEGRIASCSAQLFAGIKTRHANAQEAPIKKRDCRIAAKISLHSSRFMTPSSPEFEADHG
jgi:hypothetical protein